MFAVNRLRKSLLSIYQKRGDKKSPLTGEWRAKKCECIDPSTTLRFAQDDTEPALSLSNGCYFPEETMTLAVFKILFLSL